MWWAMRLRSVIPFFDGRNELLFFWCYLALVVLVCVLVFEYFEKPMRKWISARLHAKLN